MKEVLDQESKSARQGTTEDSIERLNREVLHFKNVLDNMWLKNTDFVYTKKNV